MIICLNPHSEMNWGSSLCLFWALIDSGYNSTINHFVSCVCVSLLFPVGVWDVCVANDCGSVGLQSRSVWCVHSEGWSTHQSNCFPSDRPPHQRVCVKMCEWQKDLFEWRLSPWGPCTPSPFLPANRCVTAQRGVQKRDVVCVKHTNSTKVSLHVCEAFSSPPEREQACLLPCPIDCVVSAFTHWSTCSRTCGSALQQRTRHVLATPLYGGADCPILTQTRPCNHDNAHPALCPSDQQEYSYSLWVGPWSPCRLKGTALIGKTTVDFNFGHDGKKTVKAAYTIKRHTESIPHQNHYDESDHKVSWEITIGYQTRQLRCTRSDGKNAMLRWASFLWTNEWMRSVSAPIRLLFCFVKLNPDSVIQNPQLLTEKWP